MRFVNWLVGLLLAAVVLAGCSSSADPTPPVQATPWLVPTLHEGESATYLTPEGWEVMVTVRAPARIQPSLSQELIPLHVGILRIDTVWPKGIRSTQYELSSLGGLRVAVVAPCLVLGAGSSQEGCTSDSGAFSGTFVGSGMPAGLGAAPFAGRDIASPFVTVNATLLGDEQELRYQVSEAGDCRSLELQGEAPNMRGQRFGLFSEVARSMTICPGSALPKSVTFTSGFSMERRAYAPGQKPVILEPSAPLRLWDAGDAPQTSVPPGASWDPATFPADEAFQAWEDKYHVRGGNLRFAGIPKSDSIRVESVLLPDPPPPSASRTIIVEKEGIVQRVEVSRTCGLAGCEYDAEASPSKLPPLGHPMWSSDLRPMLARANATLQNKMVFYVISTELYDVDLPSMDANGIGFLQVYASSGAALGVPDMAWFNAATGTLVYVNGPTATVRSVLDLNEDVIPPR